MSRTVKHSVSVAGVIVDGEQRVLLVRRRDNGEWHIPGGVLELDEDVYSGLRREVLEETGLRVEPVGLTGIYKNMTLGVVALVFRCRRRNGVLTVSDETSEFVWATAPEVRQCTTEAFAIRVDDALAPSDPIAVRTHDGQRLVGPSRAATAGEKS